MNNKLASDNEYSFDNDGVAFHLACEMDDMGGFGMCKETMDDLPSFHIDLYWSDLMVSEISVHDPKIYVLKDYFACFAGLLKIKYFDLDERLFHLVNSLHYAQDEFRYSNNIECLLSVVDDLQLVADPETNKVSSPVFGIESVKIWDALIKEVWSRTQSPSFQRRCDQRRRRAIRRKALMESYVLKVLEKYKRLLVLRIDFAYLSEHAASVSEEEARADLARLFANRRHNKSLLPDLVGYVSCIEWAVDTRYHFHVLFMLDGDRRRSDAHLAQLVGQYWVDVITKGRGRFFNCNLSKHLYRSCGIGMIHRNNAYEVTGLVKDALSYLLDKEQYLVAKTLEHSKTVFRGVIR